LGVATWKISRKRKSYEEALRLATEEWELSTDGIVTGLRYNPSKKEFIAKVNYTIDGMEREDKMKVDECWIVDNYGPEVMSKLIERGKNKDFVLCPNSKEGLLAMVQLDGENKVKRVKFRESLGIWQGMLDNGTVMNLEEGFMTDNFSEQFLNECRKLGENKFVPIPTGSKRSSIMQIYPSLHCEGAPKVKYMQGNTDGCVFRSLASAFHCTELPSLLQAANILVMRSNKFSGGVKCLNKARDIVEKHVFWLRAKRIRKKFNWEKDVTKYMFVLGVIRDSHNSQQHAVTIFRNWIFDSNEPFALPLDKKNLDICTWNVCDGKVIADSLFVNFCGGWIFYEQEGKKEKILDECVL
jgi:hypothetical protein